MEELFEGHKIFINSSGYPNIKIGRKLVDLHILIWERANGTRPDGYVIHHIDENKLNFKIDNLELLSKLDHRRIHEGWIRDSLGVFKAKICRGCNKALPLNHYNINNGKRRLSRCHPCTNKIQTNYRIKNGDRVREIEKKAYNKRMGGNNGSPK
jgi:hypothetical protein